MVLGPVRGRRGHIQAPARCRRATGQKTVGPRNLQTKRLGQAAAPVEAASGATIVQVVARRAAFAEIVRTGVIVTPRGTVGLRGDLIADRAGAAASRVVNARVCRASGHGGKVVGGAAGGGGGGAKAMRTLVAPALAHGVGHASRHSNEKEREEPRHVAELQ